MIRLSPTLSLPDDAVTRRIGILGVTGSGKTNTAKALMEGFVKARLPIVYIDPLGALWGIRSSADGKGKGYPVIILGGDHGDAALEATGGAAVADFVNEENQPVILDLSSFESKNDRLRFVGDFSRRIFYVRKNEPLHIVLDECSEYAPQRPMHEDIKTLAAIENLMTRGRIKGLGLTVISQRAARINKNVLDQVECLIVHRQVSPRDRAAVLAWAEGYGSTEQWKEMDSHIASLKTGEAYVWSPEWIGLYERVQMKLGDTFDSSATPKPGTKRFIPKTLAEVDLTGLQTRMAASLEKAKDNDPDILKKRIRDLVTATAKLRLELEKEKKRQTIKEPVVRTIHVFDKDAQTCLRGIVRLAEEIQGDIKSLMVRASTLEQQTTKHQTRVPDFLGDAQQVTHYDEKQESGLITHRANTGRAGGCADKIFQTIAAFHTVYSEGLTVEQAALFAGYSSNAQNTRNSISKLIQQDGVIERTPNKTLRLTQAGIQRMQTIGYEFKMLTRADVISAWEKKVSSRAMEMFVSILSEMPNGLTSAEVAERVGLSPVAQNTRNLLSKLRTAGLIVGSHGKPLCVSDFIMELE